MPAWETWVIRAESAPDHERSMMPDDRARPDDRAARPVPQQPLSPGRPHPRRVRLAIAVAALTWVALLIGPPVAFLRWREARLATLTDPAVQADWDAFRADMQRQSGPLGPVQRKVPKSPEPPELVWLRDYPTLAVAAWVLFAGVLGGFVALTAIGSATQDRPRRANDDDEQHKRDPEHTKK